MTKGQVIKEIKSSWVLGAIASLTVILFGGWSGTVIGWLLGTALGFVACQGKRIPTPQIGARIGANAGLILGIWLFVASILEGFVVRPLSGQSSRSIVEILQFGFRALFVTSVVAALIAALQALPSPRRQQATLVTLAFILIIFPFVDQVARNELDCHSDRNFNLCNFSFGLEYSRWFCGLIGFGLCRIFCDRRLYNGFIVLITAWH
jgi:branched-chain amino acid transport system permease protein